VSYVRASCEPKRGNHSIVEIIETALNHIEAPIHLVEPLAVISQSLLNIP
jgi:hypothetical protein